MTCSVSFEQKPAIIAYYKLQELGYLVGLELDVNGKADLKIYNADNLREIHSTLKAVGLPVKELLKHSYISNDGQFAKGYSNKVKVTVFPDSEVFKGCKIVYDEVKVPRTTVPAHTEKKARIICNGKEGV